MSAPEIYPPARTPTEAMAAAIRAEMARKGLNGKQLGELAEIDVQSLTRHYLKGLRNFNTNQVWQIAKALDIRPSELTAAAEAELRKGPGWAFAMRLTAPAWQRAIWAAERKRPPRTKKPKAPMEAHLEGPPSP